jgi:hypothetical protein
MITDDDIREMLHRRAADATVSADAWRRVEARIAAGESGGQHLGAPDGRGKWTVTMLAAAAVLVVLAASLVLLSFDDDQKVRTGPADGGERTTTSASDPSITTTSLVTTTSDVPSSDTSGSTTTTDPSATSSVTTAPPRSERLTSDSKVTMLGIGPVEVGMTMEEASQASGLTFRLTPDSFLSSDMDGCGYAIVDDAPDGLDFMVFERRIVRVDITGGGFTTVSGMGIGNTEQEIHATYDGVIVSPHEYVADGNYLKYQAPGDPTHQLLFETDGNVVTNFRSGIERYVRAVEGCA